MFVLDTNVVSELRKAKSRKADANVTSWAASVPASALFLAAVTILELETGVLLVERRDPRQGALLRTWLDEHVMTAFAGRVLPFDTAVAPNAAHVRLIMVSPPRPLTVTRVRDCARAPPLGARFHHTRA